MHSDTSPVSALVSSYVRTWRGRHSSFSTACSDSDSGLIVLNNEAIFGRDAAAAAAFFEPFLAAEAPDVCNEVAKGIAHVSLETGIPVMFGVVTTENIEQAIERAGTKAGNKGYDCAMGAIEMVNLIDQI